MNSDIVDIRNGRRKSIHIFSRLILSFTTLYLILLPLFSSTFTAGLVVTICMIPITFQFGYISWAMTNFSSLVSSQKRSTNYDTSTEIDCTFIIAVQNEPIERLSKVCNGICKHTPKNVKLILSNNGSTEAHSSNYLNLINERVLIINAPPSQMRQFGAQLLAAKQAESKWIALIDADFILQGPWLNHAFDRLLESGAKAIGYPNFSEKGLSSTSRWANSQLRFEFGIENPLRGSYNAHTLSGTMIVVLRKHFIQYYDQISFAKFTQDFDFGLWLHQKSIPFIVEYSCFGLGLAPSSPYHFAVQQVKWSDDLLLYFNRLFSGRIDSSFSKNIHYFFHASKHLLGLAIILASLGAYFEFGMFTAFFIHLVAGGAYFLVLYERGELKVRDSWYLLIFPILLAFASFARLFKLGNHFNSRTVRSLEKS